MAWRTSALCHDFSQSDSAYNQQRGKSRGMASCAKSLSSLYRIHHIIDHISVRCISPRRRPDLCQPGYRLIDMLTTAIIRQCGQHLSLRLGLSQGSSSFALGLKSSQRQRVKAPSGRSMSVGFNPLQPIRVHYSTSAEYVVQTKSIPMSAKIAFSERKTYATACRIRFPHDTEYI